MTPDERLREAGEAAVGLSGSAYLFWSPKVFKSELAARGLAVVDVSSSHPKTATISEMAENKAAAITSENVEVSKGEPSGLLAPRAAKSVSRGDVPTGNDGKQTAHPCSENAENKMEAQLGYSGPSEREVHYQVTLMRNEQLKAALRDGIHQLTTRNGYWVTDKPEFWTGEEIEIEGITYSAATGITLRSNEGDYWRDDTTEAVKRLQEVLDGDSQHLS